MSKKISKKKLIKNLKRSVNVVISENNELRKKLENALNMKYEYKKLVEKAIEGVLEIQAIVKQ